MREHVAIDSPGAGGLTLRVVVVLPGVGAGVRFGRAALHQLAYLLVGRYLFERRIDLPLDLRAAAAFRSSAGKEQRGPISKQRNAWLQTVLIEAAKLAPRWNPQLAALHARQLELGHPNRATLQVARKLVAYLLAVDKSGQPFQVLTPPPTVKNATKTKRRKRASIAKAA